MGLYSVAFKQGKKVDVALSPKGNCWEAAVDGRIVTLRLLGASEEDGLQIEIDGRCVTLPFSQDLAQAFQHTIASVDLRLPKQKKKPSTQSNQQKPKVIESPIPGIILSVAVTEGQKVRKGDTLMILEAMKMENCIVAPEDAIIGISSCSVGQAVQKGKPLFTLLPVFSEKIESSGQTKQGSFLSIDPMPLFSASKSKSSTIRHHV